MPEFKPRMMAPPNAPMTDPMGMRMISMNPASGLEMMRRPSGPMSMPQQGTMGAPQQPMMPAQQIAGMTPQQRQQLIAGSLMNSQQVQNPLQGVAGMINTMAQKQQMEAQNSGFPQEPKTMGNLFGIGNLFGGGKGGGGLY
jgi:hypothetical protein